MANFEIKINNREAKIEVIKEDGNILQVMVDGRKYEVDIVSVSETSYSILNKGKSYNVELVQGSDSKHYTANTLYEAYDIEIIDAESRYLASRGKGGIGNDSDVISTPMPGRVVRIPVKQGESVVAGQTVVVVSAMKMESEYKAPKDGIVKEVLVKEGDVVNGHQPLLVVE
jgi:biotin carboxyl carrier protein